MSAQDNAAIPSFLPVKPNFSVVVAFTLTQSREVPQQDARIARIDPTEGLIFGSCAMMVMSKLTIL